MMQAIELMTHDDFLLQYNISIDTSDVVDYMRKAIRVWTLDHEVYISKFGEYYHKMSFKNLFFVELAEILTSRGFCYSFNIADASQVIKLEK